MAGIGTLRPLGVDQGNHGPVVRLIDADQASTGEYPSAERYLLDALALDPDDPEANFNLGTLYVQNLGRRADAVPYWRRFLELQPTDPEAPRLRLLLAEIATDRSTLAAPR